MTASTVSLRAGSLIVCAALSAVRAPSQSAEPAAGFVAEHQAWLDANSDVVVLNVAAHPDDESSRTNMMLRRKHGMRVVQVYSTYGDGGQNAIGREIGPALARIRVRETLRAAAMSGAEVRWLGMPDFGFSKTREETLKFWGADEFKDRMRRVFDEVDPDVVITNHSLDKGHGHHRASIWAAIELLKERERDGRYVPRLYSRSGVDKAQLAFDPGELDPARGHTYARLAWDAWTQHESQGPWGEHKPLRVGKDYWRVVYPEGVAATVAADLVGWVRPMGPQRDTELPSDFRTYPREPRWREAAAVRRTLVEQAEKSSRRRWSQVWRRRADAVQRLMLALKGVRAEVWLEREEVPRGGLGKGFVVLHGHAQVTDVRVVSGSRQGAEVRQPARQTPFDDRPRARPRLPTPPTSGDGPPAPPPAVVADPLPGRFEWSFACAYGLAQELPAGPEPSFASVTVSFALDGERFAITERLPYTPVDPVALSFDREVVLVPRGKKSVRTLSVTAKSQLEDPVEAAVQLQMGPGISAAATPSRITLTKEQREARVLVQATIDAGEMTPDAGLAVGFGDGRVRLPLRLVDVIVPDGLRVGLVRGPEDTTERTLADLGIPFVSLDRDALVSTDLDQFSVVFLDIRAYHHRPELAEVRERLQQFCRGGGRVVSMYHKPGEWNAKEGHPLLSPFALTVGNERVTEEDAAVTLLNPEHRLMTYPHRIQSSDFEGWVQERGLNFPKTWDDAWLPMLGMKDSGEDKQHQGSLLYTSYGKGDFVYCSLSLYRQLRKGNPGAVRLLVNLLAR
ncbi:MAG: PIG-L family deacetylase [Planctomycetota bacterium]|nr:PIG-L family deacetylase [Planctomycetota bacterium]